MSQAMENVYRHHHGARNREGFSILEKERGELFRRLVGTGKRVLDLGCRDGTLTKYFTSGNDVTGADVDSHALAKVASELGIRTAQFDFNDDTWPLEPTSFDVVVAAEVIEHLYFPERVLARIHSLLKTGGILVGSVPNAFSLKCRLKYLFGSKRGTPLADPMHINQFGWYEFECLLKHDFPSVYLHPLGRRRRLMRIMPSLASFGIGFSAYKK